MKTVVVTGSFDDLRSRAVRLLEEAAKLGSLHVVLWPDEAVCSLEGKAPKFPVDERLYLLRAISYINKVGVATGQIARDTLPQLDDIWPGIRPEIWVVDEKGDSARKKAFCESQGVHYQVLREEDISGFPAPESASELEQSAAKKVIVTGCFDWFHSGHVRFFEEVSELGDLYVVVGHDANVRLLKGEGHPMFPEDERRYLVQSVRYVKQALISTGHGWMDAEPEIARIKPDIYAVNEDGDVPEKRKFCEERGLEYAVLKRTPKDGLPRRESTKLRGF